MSQPADSEHDPEHGRSNSSAQLSPPLSSPRDMVDEVASEEAFSLSRKRSFEEMEAKAQNDIASSATIGEENEDSAAPTTKQTVGDITSNSTPQPAAKGDMPPPLARTTTLSMREASQKPPRSGQGSQSIERTQNGDAPSNSMPKRNSGQHSHDATADVTMSDEDPLSDMDAIGDADEEIERFDWADLEERYHAKIKELDDKEHEIMNEFNSLSNYFSVWAQAGANREVDRTFKRLKTQIALVQHHEDGLEKKRQHYTKVVDAFKSALQLLSD